MDRLHRVTLRTLAAGMIALVLLHSGCGDEEEGIEVRTAYRELRAEALSLYLDIHPLRASSLGSRDSDSLLYTYSTREIERSLSKLSALEGELKRLSTKGLEARDIEDLQLLLSWIRSERFALGELLYYQFNPLLYCWIVEEALWGIPRRTEPPYQGELEAYDRRRHHIPELLRNAAEHLIDPPRPHVELASRRLRRLLEDMPGLERMIRSRYERNMALPDSVARAITGFLGFLEGTLPSRTRSNMILGTENMAKIFRYGEMIELDPAGLIREAEKQMRRLEIELDNLERSGAIEPSGRAVRLDSVLDTIGKLEGIGGRAASGRGSIALEPARTLGPQPPKNENLGIPAPRARLVSLVSVSPLSPEPCGLTLLYDENASNELRLLYDALGALSAREERRRLCAGRDSVRALLGSDLYSEIVRFMEIDDLIGAFPDERIRLRAMLIGEKRAALARMRLLFGIHAGTMTTEAARDYLVRTLSIGTDEAAAEVMTATYAPTAADPGIALIYLEQMLKEAAKRRDSIGPETRVRRALEEHYYLPPAMIIRYVEP